MRTLITGSWLMHNDKVLDHAVSGSILAGIDPTEVYTGCWVGVDNLASDYAKRNGLKVTKIDLQGQKIPPEVEAIILVTFKGIDPNSRWLISLAENRGIPIAIW